MTRSVYITGDASRQVHVMPTGMIEFFRFMTPDAPGVYPMEPIIPDVMRLRRELVFQRALRLGKLDHYRCGRDDEMIDFIDVVLACPPPTIIRRGADV